MRPGLLKLGYSDDAEENQFRRNLSAAVDTLSGDHDVISSPVVTLVATGAIQTGVSAVIFTGITGQKLTLPAAKSQGQGVSSMIAFSNFSTSAVTLLPSGTDTINGAKSLSVATGVLALLVSDGNARWLANV
jgi:hypothetical protein